MIKLYRCSRKKICRRIALLSSCKVASNSLTGKTIQSTAAVQIRILLSTDSTKAVMQHLIGIDHLSILVV